MTETVVTLVINELIQLIAHESKLLRGVHRDVVDIRDELESIQCFLKDVDKGDLQDGIKTWVKQVREVAYHIEDVMDEYVLHMAQHCHQQSLIGFLHKIGHIFKKLKLRHDITTKIQDIKISKILMSMTKQVYCEKEMAPGQIDMTDEITLISQLRKYLQQKRYVVVFDDVWKSEFWEIMKHALPCNDRGSRIIITTRSDLIGVSCKESLSDQVYQLQPLSQDKAWELFCRKAFHSEFQRCCPKELVKLSMDIVKKCEGLPLPIVAIGGLLSTKEKVPFEWKKLHDSLSSELECDTTFHGKSRCLSIQDARENVFETSEYSRVRSVFLFNINEMPRSFIAKLFKKFKLLKVLDFEDAPIDYLPQEVGSISEDEIIDLQSISSPPPFLEHLSLRGRLEKLPNWIPKLQNLVTLLLFFSSLEEDPLPCVQALPNLITLSLNHVYDGEQLHFEEGGFRKLKRLTLRELKTLKTVKIDRGSLLGLEQLEIGPCPHMKEVPVGIQHLESLKILDFYEMDREFVLRMQPDRGEDYWKVKKVTTIRLRYRIKGERYQIYKLGESNLLERLQGSNLEDQTAIRSLKKLKPRHGIATKIQDIKISVCEIKERSERYGFRSPEQGSSSSARNVTWHDPRMGLLLIEEDEVVSIESMRDELVSWLVG
ncbi:hypothetical protein FH972_001147 [Carpinus fangiana]|uniref:NB-ARC domain-containing protein n=1 Tax=Carpinus fangiana TaxID=176857 RepID=A0A5N6QDZ7_9ROSI|nr:hypothetical protein FH972_001147 [Carpinus fangiana]